MPEFITIGPALVEIPVTVRAEGNAAVEAFVASYGAPVAPAAPKAAPAPTPDRAVTGEEK